MKNIYILDCTLRDGGYINNWSFGKNIISNVYNGINNVGIEIIECGFIKENAVFSPDSTIYDKPSNINYLDKNIATVGMINHWEYTVDNLENSNANNLFGIRVVFYKEKINEAFDYARKVKEKGYKVFIQPIATTCYSLSEINRLIEYTNALNPFALYISDTFGVANSKILSSIIPIIDNTVNDNVKLGLHTHNNNQLAFSNACCFIDGIIKHDVIIDCSLMGIGRGAGNLPTELIIPYLNLYYNKNYNLDELYNTIDKTVYKYFENNENGYNIAYTLSSMFQTHPNYAKFTIQNDLSSFETYKFFSLLPKDKISKFDKSVADNTLEILIFKYRI